MLVNELARTTGLAVVVTGGPAEAELAAFVAGPGAGRANLAGQTSFSALVGVLAGGAAFHLRQYRAYARSRRGGDGDVGALRAPAFGVARAVGAAESEPDHPSTERLGNANGVPGINAPILTAWRP